MSCQKFYIDGNTSLKGELKIQGAKNSVLPICAAAVLCDGETVLRNCPHISDTFATCRILNSLGCKCRLKDHTLIINPSEMNNSEITDELMQQMRSSIIYMGALLGAFGKCRLSFPGGCELGPRPVDMHINAMKRLGCTVKEEYGCISCVAEKGLYGNRITLTYPSVGTTENIILAAVKAKGETVIINAAREPEIVDLVRFLKKCGAGIKGEGDSTIVINGVDKLYGCCYDIMADRIAAATYISAAVCSRGEIVIHDIDISLCESFISVFEQMGCDLYIYDKSVYVNAHKKIRSPGKIITLPHPGFPTDAAPVVMAAVCKSAGFTIFEETVFENRFRHVDSLVKMGADINVIGKAAVVKGVEKLYGAKVSATDLRGGAAMLVTALGAEGKTEISEIHHIDRGYEKIEDVFSQLGGKIIRK